ncbi:Pol protein [Phytophthora palmivora]|uniref:Pol protein n=1 Tax=Phytophthora palmivora TaxID=4796 RepID=A0A2P4YT69_9STRA|nr:Pol protein [Phytophthora palmivora]
MPDGTDQAGNIGPQAAEAAGEDAESASGVGNIVPRRVEETEKNASAVCVSSVGNEGPRGVKQTNTREEVSFSTSRVDSKAPHSESETPPARPVEEQCHVFDGVSGRQVKAGAVQLEALSEVSALLSLEELSMKDFLAELKVGEIAKMVLLKPETSPEDLNSSFVMDEDVLEGFTKQRITRLGSEILKNPEDPVYHLVKEFSDVVSKYPPFQLPPDRGVRHEIDLVPGTKYCVTRQWPLPREQCEIIDAFFAEKAKSGMVRESKSPHSMPTFCVRKPNGKWRLVHAYNKLDNATVPEQTPIPRKDVLLNNMSGCTLYSALDLVDGYYQILMRESDIPLTAASTPSGCFGSGYRVEGGQTAMEVHLKHLRRVFEVMRANKLYANIDKCVFAAEEIKVLGCFVSRKDADWVWEQQHQDAFDSIKASLQQVPVLALPDENKSFSVACDASDYAIGCALLQKDDEGRERVVSFQSRQLKAAERNYPVHDKELLAMKYALRMARWLSFFAEYNFRVEYKPDKLNVLAVALSRRPDYELAYVSRVTTDVYDRIRLAYQGDENYTSLVQFLSDDKDAKVDRLSPRQRAQLHRYELADGLLHYRRVKPSSHASAPLQSLTVPAYCWKSMSLDFVFGLPADDKGNTGILVLVCRLSKMYHLAPTDGQTERVNRVLEDTLRSICAEAQIDR